MALRLDSIRFLAGLLVAACLLGGCEGDDPGAGSTSEQAETARISPLLTPGSAQMNRTAPERFRVRLATSEGDIVLEIRRSWAPKGVDRFYNLVANGFYDRCRFFRVVKDWVVQFGLHGDPRIGARWEETQIEDDPVAIPNHKGTLAFATAGPRTRTTQIFINLKDNSAELDARGFSPFARVVEGQGVVDSLYGGYGEGPPGGNGPDQERIAKEGNAYLAKEFPNLDYIEKATIETAE
jgi:peptidyl-prolyl cis-trans isomerase A (cyclophilin A)